MQQQTEVGFIGTGTMGEPMAHNLLRAGIPLIVWNRTAEKTRTLLSAGARIASDLSEVFETARTIILMLFDGAAADAVLSRGTAQFAAKVKEHTIIQMGTVSPSYSSALAEDLAAAGGRYVEAPVSGQRGPAMAGQLVAMVAGDEQDIGAIRHLLEPMCREIVPCGMVPNALSLKNATNLYVGTMLACLVETFNFGRRQGLDLDLLASLLGNGPMASDLIRMKAPKLVLQDFSVEASIKSLAEGARLISEQAAASDAAVPMLDTCILLLQEAVSLGLGAADVTALARVVEERSGIAERSHLPSSSRHRASN
ncbi:MAG: NAD(P)-dependent oxidoreductase [Terriglobus roseus]|nr:NAD(P)-dependent oxidoreductase [Terriglobus roseus]